MTDRKQEVIIEEIIGGFFNAIRLEKDTFPRVASESTFRDIATNLYRRIAPLLVREFPEEAFRQVLIDFEIGLGVLRNDDVEHMTLKGQRALRKFKRIWEGEQAKTGDANFGMFDERRIGEERRGLDRRHCNIPKHPLSGGRIAGRRSDDNQDGPNYRARAWRINRRTMKDRRK